MIRTRIVGFLNAAINWADAGIGQADSGAREFRRGFGEIQG